MDFNAGKLNDGESFDRLTRDLFDQLVDVSSGSLSKGERAGHSQCSLWRDWFVSDEAAETDDTKVATNGVPAERRKIASSKEEEEEEDDDEAAAPPPPTMTDFETEPPSALFVSPAGRFAVDAIGLILPTSLCSGEIARMCASKLNALLEKERRSGTTATSSLASTFTRFVALPHTEGCGSTGSLFKGILGGTMGNDVVRFGVALEHGCEKHHNDAFRAVLRTMGMSPEGRVGFASVQQDGGVDATLRVVERLFRDFRLTGATSTTRVPVRGRNLCHVGIGLLVSTRRGERLHPTVAEAFRLVSRAVVSTWGSRVVVPRKSALLRNARFLDDALETDLGRHDSRRLTGAGIAVVSDGADGKLSASEVLSLLGSERSVQILVAFCPHVKNLPAHPLLPTVVLGPAGDADVSVCFETTAGVLDRDRAREIAKATCDVLRDVASGRYVPKANRVGNVLFQLPRGRDGVST